MDPLTITPGGQLWLPFDAQAEARNRKALTPIPIHWDENCRTNTIYYLSDGHVYGSDGNKVFAITNRGNIPVAGIWNKFQEFQPFLPGTEENPWDRLRRLRDGEGE